MSTDELKGVLTRVAAPLVERDSGELYLLPSDDGVLRLHLGGRFSGCPGNSIVQEQVLQPLVDAVQPGIRLELSSGALIPADAERITAPPEAADQAG